MRSYSKLSLTPKRLSELGVPLGIPEPAPAKSVIIRQSPLESFLRSLPHGGTAVILSCSIVCRRSEFHINRFELELPWSQSTFYWLADPKESLSTKESLYCFPGNGDCYPRNIVLNHRIGFGMRSGRAINGLLLGVSHAAIPPEFHNGALVPATFAIVDQLGREQEQRVEFRVVRDEFERKSKQSPRDRKPRQPIFADGPSAED